MKLRGYLALILVSLGLLVADPIQRFVISPWVKLRPGRRIAVLGRWIQAMAWWSTRPIVRVGGAEIPVPQAIVPAEPGNLILMNHQSIFDIPLVVQTVSGGYPRIVTRQRYSRFIPLISHMVQLYQYPVVDPSANRSTLRRMLENVEDAGRDSDVPLAIFPEGTRTKTGDLGHFRKAGISRLLAAREWNVYVFVADGFWEAGRFKEVAEGAGRLRGKFAFAGRLEWTDPGADPAPFLEEVHQMMIDSLAELRGVGSAA